MNLNTYLSLDLVRAWIPAMRALGVSEVTRSPRGFLAAFRRARGDPRRLSEAWRRKRDGFVRRHVAQAIKRGEPWWIGGVPTRRHLALIAWAWSPTPEKVRREAP